MRDAPGRQRQRGHPEQQHEQQREALLFEQLDQAADGLAALPLQPAFEFVADLGQGVVSPAAASGASSPGCGWTEAIAVTITAPGTDTRRTSMR